MACTKQIVLFTLLLLSLPVAFAAWEDFEGVTQWKVDVTEQGCGTDRTEPYVFVIQHMGKKAEIGDPVHGRTTGTFEGDTFHIQQRILPDGAGTSRLPPTDVHFSCTDFYTKYRWDYKDAHVSCTGTTAWQGTRLGEKTCPKAAPRQKDLGTQITEERTEEGRLKEKLAKNPKDFWANYDMAEFKKKKGDFKGYFTYLNRATANEKVFQDTREKMKAHARQEFDLSEDPTPDSVPLLRKAQQDVANGGLIYDVRFPKAEDKNKDTWYWILWNSWVPDSSKVVNELVRG